MLKKVMIIFLFTLFLAGAVGAVSAENSTDVSIDLSDVSAEPVSVEESYQIADDGELLSSSQESNGDVLDNHEHPVLDDAPDRITVNKYWENNNSGSVEHVEIELLRLVKENSNGYSAYGGGGIPYPDLPVLEITTEDGSTNLYQVVKKFNITKENNWTLTINNLFYNSAQMIGGNWVLNPYDYVIREVNIADNVVNVFTKFDSYYFVDSFGRIRWTLTNKFIDNDEYEILSQPQLDSPLENIDDDDNSTANNTSEKNSTVTNSTGDDVPAILDEITGTTFISETQDYANETASKNLTAESTPAAASEKVIDVENATGNPLIVLLMVLAIIGVPVLRRR